MKLSVIHHIAIIVSDYEKSKDFYVNKLGFEIIRENYREQRDDWKLDLRVNDTTELEIFGVNHPPKRVNRPEAAGKRGFPRSRSEWMSFQGRDLLFSRIRTDFRSSFTNDFRKRDTQFLKN